MHAIARVATHPPPSPEVAGHNYEGMTAAVTLGINGLQVALRLFKAIIESIIQCNVRECR